MAPAPVRSEGPNLVPRTKVYTMRKPTTSNGCGKVNVVLTPDGSTFSLLMNDFTATTDNKFVRKSCDVTVPVDVVPGISIGVFRFDYRGYASVPNVPKAYTQFNAEYFFAGARGPTFSQTFAPGYDDDYSLSNRVAGSFMTWSPCGGSTILRFTASVAAYKGGNATDDADPYIGLDSVDVKAEDGIQISFFVRKC
ncbi:TPA: hypothetical protein N0F65_009182 [Lagenidium giganteum]|uniref:Uncharacterized protein n=1 Tax=Lagenidium giganteum TaxID=4803 RepID=A0AAV2YBF1_9STRA|nr:TPA: hypothetical protein N0F65_009182 [Lagenidium giganteum]